MAGAMRKVGVYLGLVEQADFDDDFDDEPSTPCRSSASRSGVLRSSGPPRSSQHRGAPPSARRPSVGREPSSDLYRIETLTPRTYNEARTIGEHFRDGVPVIMNLSEIDDDDAKRLVDFAAGLVFAVHGSINRVTARCSCSRRPTSRSPTRTSSASPRAASTTRADAWQARRQSSFSSSLWVAIVLLLARFVLDWVQVLGPVVAPEGIVAGVLRSDLHHHRPAAAGRRGVIPPIRLGGALLDLSPMILLIGITSCRSSCERTMF